MNRPWNSASASLRSVHHQPGTAAEPPEHRPFADAGALRQPVHRERVGAGFLDDFPGGTEQQLPVPRGVAALGLCRGPGGALSPGLGTGTDGDEAHTADSSALENARNITGPQSV